MRAFFNQSNPSLLLAGRAITLALSFISAPIIAHSIGVAGRGESNSVVSALYIAPVVVSFGVPLAVRLAATNDDGGLPTLMAARRLAVISFPVSAALGALLTYTLFGSLDQPARMATLVGITATPLAFLWMNDLSVLVASRRFGGVLLLQITLPLVVTLWVAIGAYLGNASAASVIWANVAGNALTTAVGLALVRVPRGTRPAKGRNLLRRGAHFAGSTIAEAASNRLTQVLSLAVLGSVDAGLFSAAITVAGLLLVLGQTTASDTFRSVARAGESEWREIAQETIAKIASLALVSALGLAAVSPFLVPLLFGSDFRPAILPTLICLVGAIFMAVSFVTTSIAVSRGRGRLISSAQVVALACQLLVLVLLRELGSIGAAISWSLSFVILAATTSIGLRLAPSALIPTPGLLLAALRDLGGGSRPN